jgi:hypothetical protein
MRTEEAIRICVDAPVRRMRLLYGALYPELERALKELGFNAISKLTQTDAYYHDLEHSVLVSSVTQLMLRGRQQQEENVSPTEWASLNIAALYHDIGFVRRLLAGDGDALVETGRADNAVSLDVASNDSALMPYHVDRGTRYLDDYLRKYTSLDRNLILASVERTRFPVPDQLPYRTCDDYPGLIRAADLIGQLADPKYLDKIPMLYKEFVACRSPILNVYRQPSDMIDLYPEFFKTQVEQYVQEGLRYLVCSDEGKQVARQLFRNVDEAKRITQMNEAAVASKPHR